MSKLLFLLFLSLQVCRLPAQSYAVVTGTIDNLAKDSIQVNILLNGITRQFQSVKVAVVNKQFNFRAPFERPCLVSIMDGENYINGLIEAGDSLNIRYNVKDALGSLLIEGKGKEKFLLLQALSHAAINALLSASAGEARTKQFPYDHLHHIIDSCEDYYQQWLGRVQSQMSRTAYQLLDGEIKGSFLYKRYYSIGLVYHENIGQTLKNRKSELTPKTLDYLQHALAVDGAYAAAPTYVNQVRNLLGSHYEELTDPGKAKRTLLQKYQYLDSLLPASLRSPVLTLFLASDIDNGIQATDYATLTQFIFQHPADTLYSQFVHARYKKLMAFKNGIPAPAFTVEDENGKLVSLATFKGKVVYLDFWFEACGPCHHLFGNIKPVKEYFRNNDQVVFLTVSVDDKPVWKKALAKKRIEGYHVFTQNRGRDHAIIKDYQVEGYPTTYIIGPDGKLASVKPAQNANGLIEEIKATLQH